MKKRRGTILHVQSTPDNSNLQGKLKKLLVVGSSSYRGKNYIENDLKGNENCFELSGVDGCNRDFKQYDGGGNENRHKTKQCPARAL